METSTSQLIKWMIAMIAFTVCYNMSAEAILPQVVLAFLCHEKVQPTNQTFGYMLTTPFILPECNDTSKEATAKATDWYNVITRDNNLASLGTMGLLTVLADVVGRKPMALITVLAVGLDKIGVALSTSLPSIHYVHTASGLFGSRYLFYAIAFTAVADSSSEQSRSKDFSWLQAGMYLGMIASNFVGGFLANRFGVQIPFYASGAGFFVIILYFVFVIKESLPSSQRRRVVCCKSQESKVETLNGEDDSLLNSPGNLQRKEVKWIMLTPVGACLTLFQSWQWLAVTSILTFSWIALWGYFFAIGLYAKYRFNWGAYELASAYSFANWVNWHESVHGVMCLESGLLYS